MPICNICNGKQFVPGPNSRLTPSGMEPQCRGCRSLERQRALYECLSSLPPEILAWRRAIHFAPDASLNPNWFRSYEKSSYGGDNSIDLQAIDRPANSYDFISLSSVLEFVPDDRRAFNELLRIGTPDCLIHCTFTPIADTTSHSVTPQGKFGRYHQYGQDVADWFEAKSHGLTTSVVQGEDPVTAVQQPIHFFCRQSRDAKVFETTFPPLARG
jgi:hypothetical protein